MAWLKCLLLVAGTTLGSFGEVLCIGDDGHAKVEQMCQPCCGETDDSCFLTAFDGERDHHDDCYSCFDLPLDGPTWLRRNPETAINAFHIVSVPSQSFSPCFDNGCSDYSLYAVRDFLSNRDHSALLISTTVLIC